MRTGMFEWVKIDYQRFLETSIDHTSDRRLSPASTQWHVFPNVNIVVETMCVTGLLNMGTQNGIAQGGGNRLSCNYMPFVHLTMIVHKGQQQ